MKSVFVPTVKVDMEDIKHIFDVAAIGTWLGALVGLLPILSSAAAVIWMGIRIYGAILDVRIKKLELAKHDQQPKT